MPLLRSASGQAFLAHLPRKATESIVAQEAALLDLSEADIENICERTRKQGYGETAEGLVSGLFAVAFPVFGIDGNLKCTLSFISTDKWFFETGQGNLEGLRDSVSKLSDPKV